MNQQEWLDLALVVCNHAGIQPGSIEVIRSWETNQNTVYRLGDQRYLKLYHRDPQRQFAVECAALQTLAAGGILAPRLIAAAPQTELPPYVFTTAVPGSSSPPPSRGFRKPPTTKSATSPPTAWPFTLSNW